MDLTHSFTVPAPVEDAWATFMDLEQVGGCFPGATVTSVTDDGFEGTVKVKLGPIALVYAGSGTFASRDDSAHRAVIEAKGKDKRGNGTAGATVTIQLSEDGAGGTRADVRTDLAVTGKPAQFGRGVMQDVSDKLLQQFVDCIEGRFSAEPAPPEPVPAPPAAPEPAPSGLTSAEPVGAERAPSEPASPGPAATGVAESATPSAAAPTPSAAAPTPSASRGLPAQGRDDALDLGSTVLPVLLRSYGKQVGVALLLLLVVLGLARRRRRRRG